MGRHWIRWPAYGLLAAAVVSLVYYLRVVLLPFFLSLILAYMLEPLVTRLTRRGLGRPWAILAVYAVLGLLAAAVIAFVIPALLAELHQLADEIPRHTRALQGRLREVQAGYHRLLLPDTVRQSIDDGLTRIEERFTSLGTQVVEAAFSMMMGLFSLILVPLLTYYMLKDGEQWKEQFMAWLPVTARPGWLGLLRRIDRVLAGFVRGELVIAALMGAAVTVLIWALGMPFAVILGIFAGIGEFVPYVGPVVGALPALAVAALQAPGTLVKLIIGLVILNQVEQALLVPRVFQQSTGLHPIVIVFVLLVGGQLMGLPGAILAVPAAAIIKEIVLHLFRFRRRT